MPHELSFGASLQPDSFDAMLQQVTLLEKLGFDHVWVPDHLVFLEWGSWCFDAWCVLTGFAMNTTRIRLGAHSDPHRRHPALLAQTISTLDSISNGRAILGLGVGEAQNLLPYGIPYDKKVARMNECIEVMKKLWTGERADFDGQFHKLRKAFIQALPVQKPHPPVYVAANSPKTRELAGMSGDGWLAAMMSPKRYERDVTEITRAADRVGRRVEDLFALYLAPFSVSKDRDHAWRMIENLSKGQFIWYPEELKNFGYSITEEFDWRSLVVEPDTAQKIEAHLDEVPDEIAQEVSIFGTPDDCIEKIQRYINAGVTEFEFFMQLKDKKKCEEMLEIASRKIMPYFKEKEDS